MSHTMSEVMYSGMLGFNGLLSPAISKIRLSDDLQPTNTTKYNIFCYVLHVGQYSHNGRSPLLDKHLN